MEYQAIIASPVSNLGIRCSHNKLRGIDFLSHATPRLKPTTDFSLQVCQALIDYFNFPGTSFDLPLEYRGTEFQRRVWTEIARIPVGETITYAELAHRAGSGARAVANACGANPLPLVIPCHRVVSRHGLGGFMNGYKLDALNIKRWLLEYEGAL